MLVYYNSIMAQTAGRYNTMGKQAFDHPTERPIKPHDSKRDWKRRGFQLRPVEHSKKLVHIPAKMKGRGAQQNAMDDVQDSFDAKLYTQAQVGRGFMSLNSQQKSVKKQMEAFEKEAKLYGFKNRGLFSAGNRRFEFEHSADADRNQKVGATAKPLFD